jgi:predicted MPP superfamily phosphohydrolase
MKTTVIGDIHGRTIWQEIVTRESDSDLFVFMGDYFDSYESGETGSGELANFINILDYKRENPGKVILLIGNHDYHYMPKITVQYSRYDYRWASNMTKTLREAWEEGLLKVCHVQDDILFVHAGVTKTWCTDHDIDSKNIEEEMHELWETSKSSFGFIYGENLSPYGDDPHNSENKWIITKSIWLKNTQ